MTDKDGNTVSVDDCVIDLNSKLYRIINIYEYNDISFVYCRICYNKRTLFAGIKLLSSLEILLVSQEDIDFMILKGLI